MMKVAGPPASFISRPSPVVLDDLYRDIRPDLEGVEGNLRSWSESPNPLVAEVSRYLFQKRGKRLRPALVLLSARLLGGSGPEAVFFSSLVEVLHTASLIHDDIIDNSRTRRGRASVHAKWGPNITVLLGDYLYIKSIGLSLESRRLDVIRILADVSARMIEGELMEYAMSGNLGLSEPEYLEIIGKKTASLFSGCCQIGAVLGGASGPQESALKEYGLNLGMSFQIVDDVLDITGDPKVMGKPTLSDLGEGRMTLPLIRAMNDNRRLRGGRIAEIVQRRRLGPGERREILKLLDSDGALAYAMNKAEEYAGQSRDRLNQFPESPGRATLMALVDFVLGRER